MSGGAHFARGSIDACVLHAICHACKTKGLGVKIEGGTIPGADWVFICARCLVDACVALLPDLSREFVRWARERRRERAP